MNVIKGKIGISTIILLIKQFIDQSMLPINKYYSRNIDLPWKEYPVKYGVMFRVETAIDAKVYKRVASNCFEHQPSQHKQ